MIKLRDNELLIVENLKKYLSTELRPCEVVVQNQVAKSPDYPYVSYSLTTLMSAHQGTYCKADDGTLYKNTTQTWSFTVQSDKQEEAMELALKIHAFFTAVGLTVLADSNIAVMQVTALTPRDNMITIQYEYRVGLDVVFGLMYAIKPDSDFDSGVIDTIDI